MRRVLAQIGVRKLGSTENRASKWLREFCWNQKEPAAAIPTLALPCHRSEPVFLSFPSLSVAEEEIIGRAHTRGAWRPLRQGGLLRKAAVKTPKPCSRASCDCVLGLLWQRSRGGGGHGQVPRWDRLLKGRRGLSTLALLVFILSAPRHYELPKIVTTTALDPCGDRACATNRAKSRIHQSADAVWPHKGFSIVMSCTFSGMLAPENLGPFWHEVTHVTTSMLLVTVLLAS